MATIDMQLVRKLRSPHNSVVMEAVDELRKGGWLNSGALGGLGLRCANLQGADLREANLRDVDLRMADLTQADLSGADLQGARLNKATLHKTNLKGANLQGVDLFNTNLERVRNLADEQLAHANRLRIATMLDGTRYDGRFNLSGDLRDAQVLHVDADDPAAMADFYRVPEDAYRLGQEWAREHLSRIRREVEEKATDPALQLIAKLRHEDNAVVLKTVEELREEGWLSKGALKGVDLHRTHLKGANLNLASMEGAGLSEADLQQADLSVANLQGADLSKANLKGARLLWASLQKANLAQAKMQEVDLTGANLRDARLTGANLKGANFSAANLQRADLSDADLAGARNLREEELAKAYRLHGAVLPDGSRYDGHFNLPGDKELAREEAA